MRLWWGPGGSDGAESGSVEELMTLLRELDRKHADRPIMVDVVALDGSVVSIGVGARLAVLTYLAADQEPPYLTSRSSAPLSTGTAWFDYGGSESEFVAEALVEKGAAFSLVQSFLERGDIAAVQWAEE